MVILLRSGCYRGEVWLARADGCVSAGRACAAAAVHGRVASWGGLDGEKTRAVPNRAGNDPRDRRQAGIGLPLPDIALGRNGHGVAAAVIVAHQHRPDLEVTFA